MRTRPELERLRLRLPQLGFWKAALAAGMYTCTGGSILLGTIDLDLYIAISTVRSIDQSS